MLILLTAWFVHNWWKLLLGVVAAVLIFEYHYYWKPAREKAGNEAEETPERETETEAAEETGKETGAGEPDRDNEKSV